MKVFDVLLSDEVLEEALTRTYKTKIDVLTSKFIIKNNNKPFRLGMITFTVSTNHGKKNVEVIVKDSTHHEILMQSIANKLLPYSSPKIIYYDACPESPLLIIENIDSWVDIAGISRVNETLIDGLYEMHIKTFDNTALLSNSFSIPVMTGSTLYRRTSSFITQIGDQITNPIFERIRNIDIQELLSFATEYLVGIGQIEFPYVLVHNNFTHNSVRAIKDSNDNVHVIAYDWGNALIGWPQIDLVYLLDRVNVLAASQQLATPAPVLLLRYLNRLMNDFNIDGNAFYHVFYTCAVCNALAIMGWWINHYVTKSTADPQRVFLEINTKLTELSNIKSSVEREG